MANNKSHLLTEYCDVTRELEKIRNRVVILKDVAETRMAHAKSDRSKQKIFNKFQKDLDDIQKDVEIKQKYKKLKHRQDVLEREISLINGKEKHNKKSIHTTNDSFEDTELFTEESEIRAENINTGILTLIDKYKNMINEKIVLTEVNEYKNTKKSVFEKKKHNESVNRTNRIIKIPEQDNKSNEQKTQKIKKLYTLIDNLKMDMDD